MARYHCINCDRDFDHDGGKLRCPRCLRHNGLEPLDDGAPRGDAARRPRARRGLLLAAVGLCAAALLGGGALLLYRRATDLPRPGELAQLDPPLLARTLVARGVPENLARGAIPFTAGPQVRALAAAARDKGSPPERLRAARERLAKAFAGLAVELRSLGKTPVRDAEALAAARAKKQVERVRSFELAALTVAVLREAGLGAVLAELDTVDAPMRSADPSGSLGRYAVTVHADAEQLGGKPLAVLDPARGAALPSWAGGHDAALRSLSDTVRRLDDGSAAAHLLSLRAQSAMRRAPAKASAEAYELSRAALAAAAPSATLQLARALVLAGSGGEKDALAAAQRAATMRDDAPRRTALGRMLVALGEPAAARASLQAALKRDPRFFPALLGLAQLAWLSGKRDEGDAHLAAAEKIAPEEETVLAAAGSRLLADGKLDEGLAKLERAGRAAPDSEPVHLSLYATLVRAGKAARAKAARSRLLAIAADREQMSRVLGALDAAAARAAAASHPASQPERQLSGGAVPPPPPPLPPHRPLKLPDVSLGR